MSRMLNTNAQMKAELDLLPCFINIERISVIEQGYSHQSFKVIDQNKDYFVKRLSNFQNDEQNNLEVEISLRLTITPTLIFASGHWQVYQYINGQSLLLTTLSLKNKINICLDAMVICHQELSPLSNKLKLATLNPKKVISELSISLSVQQQLLISRIADKLCTHLLISPVTFCHGDINFSNIIIDDRAWLVDFECRCLADAEFDIAMMIAINELDYAPSNIIVEQCISRYHLKGNNKLELSKNLIMRYLGFCYLINGLWYKEQSGNMSSNLFKSKANKQFEYFDQLSSGCESLLKQMR